MGNYEETETLYCRRSRVCRLVLFLYPLKTLRRSVQLLRMAEERSKRPYPALCQAQGREAHAIRWALRLCKP